MYLCSMINFSIRYEHPRPTYKVTIRYCISLPAFNSYVFFTPTLHSKYLVLPRQTLNARRVAGFDAHVLLAFL